MTERVSRRDILRATGLAVGGAAAGFIVRGDDGGLTVSQLAPLHHPTPTPSGSPLTPVPETSIQPISGTVVQSSYVVPAGSRLRFDPNQSTTLVMRGNLIVEGILEMRPARRHVTHRIVFTGIDESKVQGGGDDPIASDVGLWVVGGGRLELRGVRTGLGAIVNGTALGALGRNVRIEGTSSGRAHLFIHTTRPASQLIDGVQLRYMGVSKPKQIYPNEPPRKVAIPGRYALHFHRCGDTSRNSVVRNTIVRDAENRGFVPHASHGITFGRDVVYRGVNDAYWWDAPSSEGDNASNDILYEDCIAAIIINSPDNPAATSGFTLPVGERNIVRRCIATGITGSAQSNGLGFNWPRSGSSSWTAEACISHHNDNGGLIWTPFVQQIRGLRAYTNSYKDWTAGAYNSSAVYTSCSFESPSGFFDAGVSADPQKLYEACRFLGPFVIPDVAVNGRNAAPVSLRSSQLEAGILIDQPGLNGDEPTNHEFSSCTRAGRDLQRSDFLVRAMRPGSRIVVVRSDGSRFEVTG